MHNLAFEIEQHATRYIGTPFKHQGRGGPDKSIDCFGLIVVVARELNLMVKDRTDYGRRAQTNYSIPNEMEKAGLIRHTSIATWDPGDVLVFDFGGRPQHIGIATHNGIVHALATAPKIVAEHVLNDSWISRLSHVFSFPERNTA